MHASFDLISDFYPKTKEARGSLSWHGRVYLRTCVGVLWTDDEWRTVISPPYTPARHSLYRIAIIYCYTC